MQGTAWLTLSSHLKHTEHLPFPSEAALSRNTCTFLLAESTLNNKKGEKKEDTGREGNKKGGGR